MVAKFMGKKLLVDEATMIVLLLGMAKRSLWRLWFGWGGGGLVMKRLQLLAGGKWYE
ncbi:UNVERIFIED_CONTAM: hypothetical protein Sradi_3340200 [Sesamum radiatum]|uniref:Uncharacterized protein n=1 Tax=Sesamum radiatum TaxID=300843 RepID=A0AAW2R2K7_SESRA